MESHQFELSQWLASPYTVGEPEEIFDELNQRLMQAGIQIQRASCGLNTLHPEVYAKQLVWQKGKGTHSALPSHETAASAMFMNSPVAYVLREKVKLHLNLEVPADELQYDFCREMKEEGATDYLILPLPFRNGGFSFISWTTIEPGGFCLEAIELLEELVPWVSLRLELESARFVTSSLLRTYLGDNAAQKVLSGAFKKGNGELIHAVILYCDLRDFTSRVDSSSTEHVLQDLDQYFSCIVKPIMEQRGEVLKYIGDAVLGVFPFTESETAACANALRAVTYAFRSLEKINVKQKKLERVEIKFGVALHIGTVMFGNIGTEKRLDFTVIGSAVNEVCRVEAMCKELGQELLVTQGFIAASQRQDGVHLGLHSLRGVEEKHELYTFNIEELCGQLATENDQMTSLSG